VPDGTVLVCLQKGYRMVQRSPGGSGSSSGGSGGGDAGSGSEGEGGHSGGEDDGGGQGAPTVRLVRPALVKVSTR
jgi:hypothetical protein